MPRIKSPISQAERDYNLRYTVGIQLRMIDSLAISLAKRVWLPDTDTHAFYQNVRKLVRHGTELTENQADWLADLYSKYTD